jgi:hypothetical protein
MGLLLEVDQGATLNRGILGKAGGDDGAGEQQGGERSERAASD